MDKAFHAFATAVSGFVAKPLAFIVATLVVVSWAVTGPMFDFSETWQLIINTSTTIVTFLMVFVIQHTQTADTVAMQLKLDEIIRALPDADNELRGIERHSGDAP